MDVLRTLLDGRGLVESPRWHGDRLFFSDWSAGEVIAVDLDGRSEVIARVKSLPLCTAWLPDGRLVIVSSQAGRLLRREPDGSLVTHAELGETGWNDIVVDGRGNAYVNRAGFDMMAGEAFKPGFVALVTANGSVRAGQAMRARRRGRRGAADRHTGPRWLCLHPRRPARDDAVHRGRRMAGHVRNGDARQRPGTHHRGRGVRGGVAVMPGDQTATATDPGSAETKGARTMFRPRAAFSGFSVDDLARAREFYVGVLGLTSEERPGGMRISLPGGGTDRAGRAVRAVRGWPAAR